MKKMADDVMNVQSDNPREVSCITVSEISMDDIVYEASFDSEGLVFPFVVPGSNGGAQVFKFRIKTSILREMFEYFKDEMNQ